MRCADDHIPPQLYVRISNRLVGEFVMTQNNICVPNEEQSIAIGDWSFDEHVSAHAKIVEAVHFSHSIAALICCCMMH
jgi:fructose-1,6-bisphosphatase